MWEILPADPQRARALAQRCGIDSLCAQLLLNRGVCEPDAVQHFLSPSLETLQDPLKLPEMAQAVFRLHQAIVKRERILVFGDSDADGITASAILYECLTARGARVMVRLSNRLADGYGFPPNLISRLVRLGIKLLILVDCGTNQRDEVRALARQGIDTIVLDHHVPSEHVARPLALVNPHRRDGDGRELCSAGLAWKLAQALGPCAGQTPERYLDLAALGTLADCAPLVGENRVLVCAGLGRLLTTPRAGLARLCEAVSMTKPTTEQVLRRLIPRLNAAGRLGHPGAVWKLLVDLSAMPGMAQAGPSAQAINRLTEALGTAHAKTRALHRQIVMEAHEQVNRIHFKDQWVIVIGRRGWHRGVMGPVASQLVERYGRPAIAIALEGRVGVGSGRSIAMFNLLEALRACEGMLLRYGGHAQACGMTLASAELEPFRDRINRHAKHALAGQRLTRTLAIDLQATLDEITPRSAATIDRLAPFGPGNPRPLLLIRRLAVERGADGGTWVTDGRARLRLRGRGTGLSTADRYDVVASPVLDGERLGLSVCDTRINFPSENLLAR